MTENEKIELFDKWYDENYDEWAEGEEGIALREELEQAFKGGIEALEEENAELKKDNEGYEKDNTLLVSQFNQTSAKLTKAIKILKKYHNECPSKYSFEDIDDMAEQFLSEVENEKH